MPGDRCVRTQRLDCHETQIPGCNSKNALFEPPVQDIACDVDRSSVKSAQAIWLAHPASVDFGHDLGGCFPGTGS